MAIAKRPQIHGWGAPAIFAVEGIRKQNNILKIRVLHISALQM